ncbi:MAG: hypothetical protein ACRC1T_04870 [Clostridium chrysemydis]|uniref:hypothetical protein n=1 Tax=Clostridium chrysemydis TaxID=2665504 RepID=UPI003F3C7A86
MNNRYINKIKLDLLTLDSDYRYLGEKNFKRLLDAQLGILKDVSEILEKNGLNKELDFNNSIIDNLSTVEYIAMPLTIKMILEELEKDNTEIEAIEEE